MKKRMFLGITLSPSLCQAIVAFERRYTDLPVRWIDVKNLHVTLIPPWYESESGRVIQDLRNLKVAMKTFPLRFTKVTFGPTPQKPRLIWAVGEASQELRAVTSQIEQCLRKKPAGRPFTSHITLARFHEKEFPSFPIKKLEEPISWEDYVHDVTLYEVNLSERGSTCIPLLKIPFEENV